MSKIGAKISLNCNSVTVELPLCYLTLVSASGVCSVKGSKVIKGSFPVEVKNSYLVCITSDEVKYRSCDLACVGAHVMVTDNGSKVIKGSFPVLSWNTS